MPRVMNLTRQCSVCPRTPPCRHRQPNNNLRVGHSAGATSPIPPSARLPAPEVTSNDCSNDRIDDRLRSTVNRVRGRMNRNHPRPRPGRMGVNPPTRRVPEGSPVIEGAESPPDQPGARSCIGHNGPNRPDNNRPPLDLGRTLTAITTGACRPWPGVWVDRLGTQANEVPGTGPRCGGGVPAHCNAGHPAGALPPNQLCRNATRPEPVSIVTRPLPSPTRPR